MSEDPGQLVGCDQPGQECSASERGQLSGAGLASEEFTALTPEARRLALVEQSARFAGTFGRWKDAGRAEGLGWEQMRLLQSLHCGGPAIMREMGDKLMVTPRNMTAFVDQLEEAALVVRRPHPSDRRATLIELTPAGAQLADSSLLLRMKAIGEIFDKFSDEQQRQFYAALGVLIDVMHGGSATC
jgi:DNA-binding MarR family transcriptional regulator